jgi:phage FluMu gp28-like protein
LALLLGPGAFSGRRVVDQWQYQRPALYAKQEAAIFDPARFTCIEAGTKSGKTVGCIAWLFENAWMGKSGWNHWWVAPYYGQARIAYERMKAGVPPQIKYYNDHDKFIKLTNGAFMWFKSAEKPDAMYGEDVHSAVVDEASRVREESWWALRSTLTATGAPARLIGNVKGKLNWFYRLSQRARAYLADWSGELPKEYSYHRITALDAVEAGIFPMSEVESARKDLPEDVFRELYMAEATELGANPFGIESIRNCTVSELSKEPPVAWGWDLARKRDWTVGVGLDVYGKVAKFHRFQMSWPQTVETIVASTSTTPALVDSTGLGDVVLQQLERDGGRNFTGYLFTQRSKQQLMEGLALAIQRGEVYFPSGVIVDELESFEYEHTRTGVSYNAPEGLHDDCVCALALARQALVTTRIAPAEVW